MAGEAPGNFAEKHCQFGADDGLCDHQISIACGDCESYAERREVLLDRLSGRHQKQLWLKRKNNRFEWDRSCSLTDHAATCEKQGTTHTNHQVLTISNFKKCASWEPFGSHGICKRTILRFHSMHSRQICCGITSER